MYKANVKVEHILFRCPNVKNTLTILWHKVIETMPMRETFDSRTVREKGIDISVYMGGGP